MIITIISLSFLFFTNISFFLNNIMINIISLLVIMLFVTRNSNTFLLLSYSDLLNWRVLMYFTLMINLWFFYFLRFNQYILLLLTRFLNLFNDYFYYIFISSFNRKLNINNAVSFVRRRLDRLY